MKKDKGSKQHKLRVLAAAVAALGASLGVVQGVAYGADPAVAPDKAGAAATRPAKGAPPTVKQLPFDDGSRARPRKDAGENQGKIAPQGAGAAKQGKVEGQGSAQFGKVEAPGAARQGKFAPAEPDMSVQGKQKAQSGAAVQGKQKAAQPGAAVQGKHEVAQPGSAVQGKMAPSGAARQGKF